MYSIAVLTFAPKHYTSNDINEMNSSLAVILWTKAQYSILSRKPLLRLFTLWLQLKWMEQFNTIQINAFFQISDFT